MIDKFHTINLINLKHPIIESSNFAEFWSSSGIAWSQGAQAAVDKTVLAGIMNYSLDGQAQCGSLSESESESETESESESESESG